MATQDDVKRFLKSWKKAAAYFIDFVPRNKNIEGLQKLGLNVQLARKILKGLAVEDYVSGPELDRDKGTNDIWVFGVSENNQEVYIKIKLFSFQGQERAKCISFHPAEHPLKYPLSGGNTK